MPERVSPAGGRWSTFRLIVMVRLRRRTGYSVIRALSPVRSISSCVGTWLLSSHDSRAAPQTVQTASPVCGTKNFSSVRLYSAPQLHWTIVAISGIGAPDRPFSSPEPRHIQTDPPTHCRAHDLHARRTRDLSSIVAAHKFKSESDQ